MASAPAAPRRAVDPAAAARGRALVRAGGRGRAPIQGIAFDARSRVDLELYAWDFRPLPLPDENGS